MAFNYKKLKNLSYYVTLYLTILVLNGCSNEASKLEKIKTNEVLRVAIIAHPPHYFNNRDEKRGYDFDLVYHYATKIGVKLKIIEATDSKKIVSLLEQNRVDIGITGSMPDSLIGNTKNAITYNDSEWYLIGNRKNKFLPKSISEIKPNTIILGSNSNANFIIDEMKKIHESIVFKKFKSNDLKKVLAEINNDNSKFGIINSDIYAYYQYLYPETKVIFTLPKKYPSRWLIKDNKELSFMYSINNFFIVLKKNANLKKIREIYFEHLDKFDYIDVSYYLNRINKKLPSYKKYFKKTAKYTVLDPRMVAAVSYQESHWNRKARSPTGVRGMMMLTLDTAERVGVKNRLNAKQSIYGGAKYLEILYKSFSNNIQEIDRLYFTLAAYNIGLGHLKDARSITKAQGGDPNEWNSVKKHLPKLSQKKWYRKTKHGFARGQEPIEFIRRVMLYYDILCMHEKKILL